MMKQRKRPMTHIPQKLKITTIIKQGDSDSEVIICFSAKFKVSVDFQQCGMCDQQRLRPVCAYAQSDQSLCLSLNYSMTVKLLTEQHLEFTSLSGGCTGLSESYTCQNATLFEITFRGSNINCSNYGLNYKL